jgi:hypothetical protein
LELYEWVKKDKTFTAYYPDYFFQNCDQGPCEWKWNFALVDRYGVQPLTVSEFLYLSFWLGEGTPKCTDIETQRFYRWQGGKITLEREVYLPSQSDELYCRIAWAIAVIRGKLHGWQDDDAINILADALKDWPEIMNTTWGPASQDYFYLQMGIWRDFRGEEEDALTLLQLLAENPTDPQYTLPARLASTYLEERSRSGFVGACTQVQRLWKDAVNELPESHGMYTHYPKDIRLAWGFADDRWGPYGIEDLCSRQDSFYALRSLQNLGFSP